MSTSQSINSDRSYRHHTSHESWLNTLIAEGPRLDETGTKAALFAVDAAVSSEREATQLFNLLRASTNGTDQMRQIGAQRYAILLAPIDNITTGARRAQALQDKAQTHKLQATIGFAIRRDQESLLDTWARAEAELDRMQFRNELRLPSDS